MFFKPKPCQVCLEKDQRIADLSALLKAQTELVKWVVSPTYMHAINQQANLVMDGASEAVASETPKFSPVELQAMQMLSGDYN